MKLSRKSRFVTALIALMSVLFTQLALAAYVCPTTQIVQAVESVAVMHAATHPDMADCEGMAVEETALCQAQSQVVSQSLDKPESPLVSPFLATMLMSAISYIDPSHQHAIPQASASSLTRLTAPPLAIQHCCFRI